MIRMKRAVAALVAFAALSLSGCQHGPPTIGDPPPQLKDANAENAYQAVLKKYSANGEIYSTFDTQAFTGATFQTWTFREARVKRMAEFQEMTPEEVQKRLADERADYDKFNVFDFGAWTQDPKFDDFETKKSIWRLALVTDRGELLPVDVERVQRVNQNLRALYPYMGQFWVFFRVKFPKTLADGSPAVPQGTDHVTLRVTSTLGKAELRTAAE